MRLYMLINCIFVMVILSAEVAKAGFGPGVPLEERPVFKDEIRYISFGLTSKEMNMLADLTKQLSKELNIKIIKDDILPNYIMTFVDVNNFDDKVVNNNNIQIVCKGMSPLDCKEFIIKGYTQNATWKFDMDGDYIRTYLLIYNRAHDRDGGFVVDSFLRGFIAGNIEEFFIRESCHFDPSNPLQCISKELLELIRSKYNNR